MIVVGNGFAALTALNYLSKQGVDVTQVGPRYFEYLPSLAAVIAGRKRASELRVEPKRRWKFVEGRVVKVFDDEKRVKIIMENEEKLKSKKVILAIGARPWVPIENVYVAYNMNDAEELSKRVRDAKRIGVVGSGLVGLEVAGELASIGKEVIMFEALDVIAPSIPCPKAREAIKEVLRRLGIELVLNAFVKSVEENKVILRDGKKFDIDLVIWSAGVMGPAIEIPCTDRDRRGFIRVDNYLRAIGCKNVYVPGDANAMPVLKMAEEAMRQGWYLGKLLTGKTRKEYKPLLTFKRPFFFIAMGPEHGVSILGCKIIVKGKLAPLMKEIFERMILKMVKNGNLRPPVPI